MTVLERQPTMERPRVDCRREFAWVPRLTADAGMVWLQSIWAIRVDDEPATYSRDITPLWDGQRWL